MTFPVRLYFLRVTSLLSQGALLIAATVLFAFGMLDLFNVIALIALALIWVLLRPAATKEARGIEYEQHDLGNHVDSTGRALNTGTTGITLERYLSIRGLRARARTRKVLGFRADRFDLAFAVVTTLVWLSYFGFISSVIAGA